MEKQKKKKNYTKQLTVFVLVMFLVLASVFGLIFNKPQQTFAEMILPSEISTGSGNSQNVAGSINGGKPQNVAGATTLESGNQSSDKISTLAVAEENHTNHTGWTALPKSGGVLGNGKYYLNGDLTLSANFTTTLNKNINICLNGYKLTGKAGSPVITNDGGNLFLYDCQSKSDAPEHQHEYEKNATTGLYDFTKTGTGTKIKGGVITGGGGSTKEGGGVFSKTNVNVVNLHQFTMFGGTIAGNTAKNGGGVYVNKYFSMRGGNILGNTATENGGGIFADVVVSGATMYETATISDNKAKNGGGIYHMNSNIGSSPSMDSSFVMGGTISNNTATENGGGVYNVSEDSENWNKTISKMQGGKITGNTAAGSGGGVYNKGFADIMLSRTQTITGNKQGTGASMIPSNVYLVGGRKLVVADALKIGDVYAKIGVTLSGGGTETFTKDYEAKNPATAPSKIFTMDNGEKVALSNGEVQQAPPHSHTDRTEFINKLTEDSETLTAGNYVLEGDVTLKKNLIISGEVSLCLNGYKLTGNGSGAVITINPGDVLTLFDCQVDSVEPEHQHTYEKNTATGVYDFTKTGTGTTIKGGVITGGSTENGGGVSNAGTFNILAGTIAGNTATTSGGGVLNVGTFTIKGTGTIAGNTATTNGGGVYNQGEFKISGTPKIFDNTIKDTTDPNNIYLLNGKKINVTGALKTGETFAKIGVTLASDYETGAFTSGFGANNANTFPSKIFTIDKDNLAVLSNGEAESVPPHIHDGVTFNELTETGGTLAPGNYVIYSDVQFIKGQNLKILSEEVSICLNGHNLTGAKSEIPDYEDSVISINVGATLNLYDCQENSTGTITGVNRGVYNNGTFNMHSGTISGNIGGNFGSGVNNNGTFNMHGGTITDNHGGTITAKDGSGGGVYNSYIGTFNMFGGTISKNTASEGGGVFNANIFKMSGGAIDDNETKASGGGVYTEMTFEMSGTAQITNNLSEYIGGGVSVDDGTDIMMSGGKISGNTAYDNGGGVYSNGTFKLSGASKITGNDKYGEVNNIHLGSGEVITFEAGKPFTGTIGVTSPNTPYQFTSGFTASGSTLDGATITADNPNNLILFMNGELKEIVPLIDVVIDQTQNAKVYDGASKTYNITGKNQSLTGFVITYKGASDSTYTSTAPTNAGEYDVKITRESDDVYKAFLTEIIGGLKITQAPNSLTTDLSMSGWIYGETENSPTAAAKYGSVVFTYQKQGESNFVATKPTTAGTHTVKATVAENPNYAGIEKTVTFTVEKRAITVTASETTKTYGEVDPAFTHQITTGTLVSGDSLTGALSRVVGENKGTYAIGQGTLTAGENYAITYVGANLTINAKALTVTAKAGATLEKVYDGNSTTYVGEIAVGTNYTLNTVGEDTISLTIETITFNTKNVGATSVMISYSDVLSGDAKDNYTVVAGTFENVAKITKKDIIITGVTAGNKSYDGNATAVVTGTSAPSENFDNGNLTITNGIANFADVSVNSGITVTFSGFSLSGSAADNYNLTAQPVSTTANITPKELTVVWDNSELSFTGEELAPTATVETGIAGETLTLVVTGGKTNVGVDYVATASTTNGNYTLTNETHTFKIGKATPTLTMPTSVEIKYGQLLSESGLTGGSAKFILLGESGEEIEVTGTFAWTDGTQKPTVLNSGFEVTFTPTGDGANNFSKATGIALVTVARAPLTITANAKAITYGNAPANDGVTYSGFVFGESETVLGGTLGYTYDYAQYGDVTSDVNGYSITPNGSTADNYEISFESGVLTVNKKNITATITAKDKEYDGTTSAEFESVEFAGAENSDVLSVTGGTVAFDSKNANDSIVTNQNGYVLSGEKAGNYTLTTITANNAKISKKALIVTSIDVLIEKNYDANTAVKTVFAKDTHYTITGEIAGDTVDITVTSKEYSTAVIGENTVNVVYTLDTSTAQNYTVATTAMEFKGNIISAKTTEGTDYVVTSSSGKEPVEVGGVKYYDGDIIVTLKEGGGFTKIALTQEELAGSTETSLQFTGDSSSYSFYVQNGDAGEIGKVVLQYGIDTTAPEIIGTEKITDTGTETEYTTWFNDKTVTVSVGGISDIGSGIYWGEDTFPMTLTKDEVSVPFTKDAENKSISFDLENLETNNINGTYKLTVYDYVGGEISKEFTISKHDSVMPEISINDINYEKWNGAITFNVTYSDVTSGIRSATFAINGKVISNDLASVTHSFNDNGIYRLKLVSTDNAGNSTTVEKTLRVDTKIDEFMTKYGEFENVDGVISLTDENDSTATEISNFIKDLTTNQKEHIFGNTTSNEETNAKYDKVVEYVKARKEEVTEKKRAEIVGKIENITNPTNPITKADLDNLVKELPLDKGVEDKLTDAQKQAIKDIEALQKVADLLSAKPDNNTQLNKWVGEYNKLNEVQKGILEKLDNTAGDRKVIYDGYKTEIDTLVEEVKKISKLTKENLADVKALVETFNEMKGKTDGLNSGVTEQNLVQDDTASTINKWISTIGKVDKVETAIEAIPAFPTDYDKAFNDKVENAQKEYDNLTSEEKALVDGGKLDGLKNAKDANDALKAGLDKAKKDAIDFENKVNKIEPDKATVEQILDLEKEFGKLDQTVKDEIDATVKGKLDKLLEDAAAVKGLIDKIKEIDLNNTTRVKLEEIVSEYETLTEDQKKLVDNSVDGKYDKIKDLLDRLNRAKEAIDNIPDSNSGDDCGLCENGAGEEHDLLEHLESIEKAKMLYEKLNENEHKMLESAKVEKIAEQYAKLKEYLAKLAQNKIIEDKAKDLDIYVYGLATQVDTKNIPDNDTAETIIISILATKTNTTVNNLAENRQKLVSYDIKLMVKAGNNDLVSIQPTSGKSVAVRISLGKIVNHSTTEIYHVSDNGSKDLVENVTYIDEGGKTFAVFNTNSFSEYVVLTEKDTDKPSGGGSTGGGTTISKENIFWSGINTQLKLTNTDPIVVDNSAENYSIPKYILENQKATSKTLTIKFADGEITITKEMAGKVSYTQESYTFAELKALFAEKPVVTPTPTPTPTPEPTTPEVETCNLWWLWILIALVVIGGGTTYYFVNKNKKKNKEENKKK